jgi:predicted MFS family arabinose efflux permease
MCLDLVAGGPGGVGGGDGVGCAGIRAVHQQDALGVPVQDHRQGLLDGRTLVRANLGIMTLFGAYVGFQFVITLYLQAMNHWSPIKTALAFLPVGVLIAVGAVGIGPVVQRAGTERLIAAGFLGIVAGYALLLRIMATPAWAAVLLPTTLLVGAGIGVAFPPLNIQAVTGVAAHEQGIAGAIFQASNQIGAAVVLAAVTAVVTSNGGASTQRAVMLAAYRHGLLVVAAVAAAGLLIALSALIWRPIAAKAPA